MFRFGKVRRPRKNNWRTRWAGTSWQGFTFLQTTNPTNSKYQQFEVISTSPRLQMQYWNIMKGPWDRWDLAYLSFHTILFFFLTFFTVTIFQCCVRTDENKPFAIDRQKPDGAGFYSEDLSYKEFKVKHLAVFFFFQINAMERKNEGKKSKNQNDVRCGCSCTPINAKLLSHRSQLSRGLSRRLSTLSVVVFLFCLAPNFIWPIWPNSYFENKKKIKGATWSRALQWGIQRPSEQICRLPRRGETILIFEIGSNSDFLFALWCVRFCPVFLCCISSFVHQAADKTDNPSLAKFLRARAQVPFPL